jgi:16S rRNA (uracil1498-N3)-methyltransferase
VPHFFVPPSHINGGRFFLAPEESAHLARVLRKKRGDEVGLFDGENRAYRGVLETITPERVAGRILEELSVSLPPFRLRLFQGLPKGEKFEFILEKAAELGVGEIVPVLTRRTVAVVPEGRAFAKRERWKKIVRAASAQCGRADIPVVKEPHSFGQALACLGQGELTLIAWEGETRRGLKEVLRGREKAGGPRTVNVMIGPEGGFDPREVDRAVAAGAVPVTLGPRILRAETAGIVVAAALLYEWGGGI